MTGPEHYREAERLLAVQYDPVSGVLYSETDSDSVAMAQVHATLALAASNIDRDADHVRKAEWVEVTS